MPFFGTPCLGFCGRLQRVDCGAGLAILSDGYILAGRVAVAVNVRKTAAMQYRMSKEDLPNAAMAVNSFRPTDIVNLRKHDVMATGFLGLNTVT